jgi:hypothetical protein
MAAATTITRTKPVRRESVDAIVMAAAPRASEGLFVSVTSVVSRVVNRTRCGRRHRIGTRGNNLW